MSIFEDLLLRATANQQYFYEHSNDWNVYKKDERNYLRNYIGYALYGPPEYEQSQFDEEDGLYVYKEDEVKHIELLIDKIVKYGSLRNTKDRVKLIFDDGDIFCLALNNFTFADKKSIQKFEEDQKKKAGTEHEKSEDGEKSKDDKDLDVKDKVDENLLEACMYDITPTVIFKFKILKNKKEDAWFMDMNGRIYKSWIDYIENNTLMKCTMVLPKGGEYQPDPVKICTEQESNVWIEYHQSPACSSQKLVRTLDAANLAGSVGAIGVSAVAVFTPVAPVAITAALVTGVVSGAWGIGRSMIRLIDRTKHEEPLASKETVGDWLTIGSSTFGILSIGASRLLSKAIEKGVQVGRTGQILHDSINGGSIIMNGFSVGYRSCDIVMKKEKIQTSDIFFLACDIFFLCNSVVNIKLAKNIIENSQTKILDDYKDSLSTKRHKKAFNQLVQNSANKAEIIQGINKIADKDEFFAAMVKNRKTIDPQEFSKLSINERVNLVSEFVSTSTAAENTSFIESCKSLLQKSFSDAHKQISSNVETRKFVPVYSDIKSVLLRNADVILLDLLEIGHAILSHVAQNDTRGELLASILDFLWRTIKGGVMNLKRNAQTEVQMIVDLCITPLLSQIDQLVIEWQDDLRMKFTRNLMRA